MHQEDYPPYSTLSYPQHPCAYSQHNHCQGHLPSLTNTHSPFNAPCASYKLPVTSYHSLPLFSTDTICTPRLLQLDNSQLAAHCYCCTGIVHSFSLEPTPWCCLCKYYSSPPLILLGSFLELISPPRLSLTSLDFPAS